MRASSARPARARAAARGPAAAARRSSPRRASHGSMSAWSWLPAVTTRSRGRPAPGRGPRRTGARRPSPRARGPWRSSSTSPSSTRRSTSASASSSARAQLGAAQHVGARGAAEMQVGDDQRAHARAAAASRPVQLGRWRSRICLGSMKRTSSRTTSNSVTSLHAAGAEEVDEVLHELLGRAGTRGDAHDAPALEPLLAHLARRCRSGVPRCRSRGPPRRGAPSSRSCASRSPASGRSWPAICLTAAWRLVVA